MKMYEFLLQFDWSLFIGSNEQYSSISSDNNLTQPGDKPLFEPMMLNLLMHICVTWLHWVDIHFSRLWDFMLHDEIITNLIISNI